MVQFECPSLRESGSGSYTPWSQSLWSLRGLAPAFCEHCRGFKNSDTSWTSSGFVEHTRALYKLLSQLQLHIVSIALTFPKRQVSESAPCAEKGSKVRQDRRALPCNGMRFMKVIKTETTKWVKLFIIQCWVLVIPLKCNLGDSSSIS